MTEPARGPYQRFPTFRDWSTTRFDEATVERFSALLQQTKEATSDDALLRAVQTATKWAAIDTGAIEGLYEVDRGFTLTVALEAAAWANIHLVKGEAVQRAIQDALDGYDYVLDLATGASPVTEVWIKQLHQVLCASQETYTVVTAVGKQEHPLKKGEYKSQPNSPFNIATETIHEYAPVDDVPAEMHRLVDELNADVFRKAHPVVQAAYAHYSFVCIHPFADGNGRVSRALASVYLYRSPGVPLVVFADQKAAYLDALEAADRTDPIPFIQFVADRVVDTIQMVRTDMARRPGPSLQERMTEFQTSLTGRGGLLHSEIDALALRLLDVLQASFERHASESPLRAPLSILLQPSSGTPGGMPPGYRQVPNGARSLRVVVTSAPPANAQVARHYGVVVARPDHDGADFVVFVSDGRVLIDALLRELTPSISVALTYRSDAVAEAEIISLVDQAATQGVENLRAQGYRQ
jgi:Fic family protein